MTRTPRFALLPSLLILCERNLTVSFQISGSCVPQPAGLSCTLCCLIPNLTCSWFGLSGSAFLPLHHLVHVCVWETRRSGGTSRAPRVPRLLPLAASCPLLQLLASWTWFSEAHLTHPASFFCFPLC